MFFDKNKIIAAIDLIKKNESDFSKQNLKILSNNLEDYLSGYENEDNRNLVLIFCLCHFFEKDKIKNVAKTKEKLAELSKFFSSGDAIEIIEKTLGINFGAQKVSIPDSNLNNAAKHKIYCDKCGTKLSENYKFCPKCGTTTKL